MNERTAKIERQTSESSIRVAINLDGDRKISIQTGLGMLDHMLTLFAFWANFDLDIQSKGDLHVDAHHTAEDIGICLGKAIHKALCNAEGNVESIVRTAAAKVPMDEALAEVCIDISGRPWLEWRNGEILPAVIAGEERDLWREYYKSLASSLGCNIHISFLYGKNGHHLLESVAKGLGLAFKQAVRREGSGAPSTKGVLDFA